MCSAMVLPTLGRTLFRSTEPQLPGSGAGPSITDTDTLGRAEIHHDYIDFCSFDMDSDVDVSNNIGHIITSLSSQIGRGADPAQESGYEGSLRQWSVGEKRTEYPVWPNDIRQQLGSFATSNGYATSPDRYSDSGTEPLDTDSNPHTPPPPQQHQQLPGCLPSPLSPPSSQLRQRLCSQEEEDVLAALQNLNGLHLMPGEPGIAAGHGQQQSQELDIEKLVTDYLCGPEDVAQQTSRPDELAAALARVSGTLAPATAPVSIPVPAPVSAPPVMSESRPMGPASARARPLARWGGLEGGSSILEGVLRGTLTPRVTSSPCKPMRHCFSAGGFHGYSSGGEVRGHGLYQLTPSPYSCGGSSAGSPGRTDSALSPVAVSPETFGSGSPLTSSRPQPKQAASRKRKYAKRCAGEGDAPPSRGRLLHFCPICSKGFKDKYSVNVHIRTHTGEKPFQCELCNKCFRQKAHLAKHVHIHSSPKTPPAKR